MSADLQAADTTKLQTRYRLLEIAARHIALHGFEGASLRKIAEEAGVTAAAIYRHYPGGKKDLYEATLKLVSETVTSLVTTESSSRTAIELVLSQCNMMWQFFAEHPNVASMIVRENISGGSDGPSPYLDQHVKVITMMRTFLQAAITRGEIKPINISAFLFWITSYVTNFHGCTALRETTWQEQDINNAREEFLIEIRYRLTP